MSSSSSTTEEDAVSSQAGTITKNALSARELEWAVNPAERLADHASVNGPLVRTRFPPEPNGYLHIGHAKSMNMNFSLCFEKLGVSPENRRTVFRYDDTNPDAESEEYIDSIYRDLSWLGWKPEQTTYASDNFGKLYEFAMQLIRKGLAYVCDMTKPEMEAQRDLAKRRSNARNSGKDPDLEAPIPSPDILPGRNRNTPIERNLSLFENMRMGLYEEGQYTLRLKMDFESSNPNMYDLVAYRIKYTPHPHAGKGWCIYPAYDFTHGICDSLEHIDYSICTLEFESRREPYYWILWALDLYRPKVYEMSRLNLQYTVLSKRKLIQLVQNKIVRGWDDPRMPTISGLRRRGYTKDILNSFCNDVGATRALNVVEIEKLFQTSRLCLATTSRRAMAALEPIKVIISNFNDLTQGESLTFVVQNSPTDDSLGSHTVTLTPWIYLDSADFRMEESESYYGLTPVKPVGLKYHGGNLHLDRIIATSSDGTKVLEMEAHLEISDTRIKPKSFVTWVPNDGVPCEVRIYNHLFTVPEPSDRWDEELNPNSEVIYSKAVVDRSVVDMVDAKWVDKWHSNPSFQFERLGYFVVDTDTNFDSASSQGLLVFNRTVSLKEEVAKKQISEEDAAALKRRKEKQQADKEAKEARMRIALVDLFRLAPEFAGLYSRFDDDGMPTHDVEGKEVTKSSLKKLAKERMKHEKLLASATG